MFPLQIVGLFTVTVGAVVIVRVPLAGALEHDGVVVVLTVTVYVPAVDVEKLATLPGLDAPDGTVHT